MRTHDWKFACLTVLILAPGCYSVRDDFRPIVGDVEAIQHLGELRVISDDELREMYGPDAERESNFRTFDPSSAPDAVYYGQLGAPVDPGTFGGATFTFLGTGGPVCLVVDPESVYWNREISEQARNAFEYDDAYRDDGDLDMTAGLSAYYTGSPGVEIGGFEATYSDAAGADHTLQFNECLQYGYFGDPAHAGRGAVESCTIDTSLRAGISFTGVLETFALPIDDSILNFGVMVYDGACGSLPWWDPYGNSESGEFVSGSTECVLGNEVGLAEPDGVTPETKSWAIDMEIAYCAGSKRVNTVCEEHLGDVSPPCIEP